MAVRAILTTWLRDHGYDGLCYEDCGCGVDNLAPCGSYCMDCEPAYRMEPPDWAKREGSVDWYSPTRESAEGGEE